MVSVLLPKPQCQMIEETGLMASHRKSHLKFARKKEIQAERYKIVY